MFSKFRSEMQAALTLVAAVVGAGFASGLEIMRFFTAYGAWSWAGCVVAAILLASFSAWAAIRANVLQACDLGTLCKRSLGGSGGHIAAWLNGALCVITAGAMLAAMGELFALALPIQNAYAIGIAVSLLVGGILSYQGLSSLAAMCGWLLPACLLLYTLLLNMPKSATIEIITPANAWHTLPMAFAYAAMNAALGCGVLCEIGQGKTRNGIIRACGMACALFLLMLLSANTTLYRHQQELLDEALPVVQLARSLGAAGYWLCIVVLMLAVMTTLTALLRTFHQMLGHRLPSKMKWPIALLLPLGACLTGFDTLVGHVYPMLGVASTLLFLMMMVKPLASDHTRRSSDATFSQSTQ